MSHTSASVLTPSWPAPPNIRAFCTTRLGGVSVAEFDSFNLASHVGDDPGAVQANRAALLTRFAEDDLSIQWLNQTHNVDVFNVDRTGDSTSKPPRSADAAITKRARQVCVVLTADCLPLLFCDEDGAQVAAVHAGWRGLANGIVLNTVNSFDAPASSLLCFLGPAISQSAFQVGEDVKQAFLESASAFNCDNIGRREAIAGAFRQDVRSLPESPKYYADLYKLARLQLSALGVHNIFGGEYCSYRQSELFFSYRRDGQTGRMASGIWIAH